MHAKAKNFAKLALKLSVAVFALWYVFRKVDFSQVADHFKSAEIGYLIAAFACFLVAGVFSGLRLKQYFIAEQIDIGKRYSVVLYLVGTFFNTVLPSGIGGDGYLTIHLNRRLHIPAIKTIRILLTTRANGLFFLNLFFFYFILTSKFNSIIPYEFAAVIGLFLLQIPVYFLFARKVLKESFSTFLRAGGYSIISQTLGLAAALLCFKSIGLTDNITEFLTIFLGAAIAAIVPITPGGAGVREFVYFHGAQYLGLDTEFALAASLIYFSVYFASSLCGLVLYLCLNKIDPKR